MADSLIKALLVEDLEIPVFVEKEFNVRCCIRGYHIYQIQWNTGIGARLTTAPETRPGALAEDKYAIAVISNGKTVGHVPKFTFFFLKNAGKLHITVTGPRRYSADLKQGGLELPVDFCFTSLNKKLFLQTLEEVQKYEKQKKGVEQKIEKKETGRGKIKCTKKKKKKKSEAFSPSNLVRVIYIFPLIISAAL